MIIFRYLFHFQNLGLGDIRDNFLLHNLLPYLNGYRCDQDIDECLERPCQNGATCEQDLETPGKYTCYCSDEFIGQHCEEVKIKTCDNYPCENGATCTDDPGMQ